MNKKGFERIVIDLVVVFILMIQTVVPVLADEILIDDNSTTGSFITAGVASIINSTDKLLLCDESEVLISSPKDTSVINDGIDTHSNEDIIINTDNDDVLIESNQSEDSLLSEIVEPRKTLSELYSDETDSNINGKEYIKDEVTLYGSFENAINEEKENYNQVESYYSDAAGTEVYDANNAVKWAKNNLGSYNGENQCANFVSACLRNGGLSGANYSLVYELSGKYGKGGFLQDNNFRLIEEPLYYNNGQQTFSGTWQSVRKTNNSHISNIIAAGDIIVYSEKLIENEERPKHIAIVSDVSSDVIKVCHAASGGYNNNEDAGYYNAGSGKRPYIYLYHYEGGGVGCDCKMKNGVDKVKEGEYVIVSALSLDDNGKIKKNRPYALDLDDTDVVVDRSLSDKTPVWEIEHIEKRFYNIYNRKRNKVISLEDRNCDDKTNIHICRWNEDNHESWWSFSEEWDGQYIIENKYSEMCATRSNGDSVKQREFYGRKDDAVDNQLWLLVRPDKPTIKTGGLPKGEVGKGYSVTLEGDCDEWIAIEWSLAGSSGALPNGLSLSKDGVLSGTPTETGTFNLKIIAENEFGYTTENYTLVIEGGVSVTGITLNKTSLELSKGSVAILTPTVSPENATDKSFTCKSSDENVVTVSSSGKTVSVTPVNEGTATITVTSNSNKDKSASCKVTVKPSITQVTSVSLNKSSLELIAGSSEILIATVLPGTATDRSVTWKSSDEKVATVSSSGKVTAIKEGNATITVTSNSSNDKSASCKITVKPAPTGVIIKADEVNGAAGKEVSVPVRISNNTGLGSMALTITSDSDLTLSSIEKGSLLSFGTFNADKETGFVQWYTSSDRAVTGDGVLFTLKFSVKAGAEKKSHPVNISFKDNLRENVTDEKSNVLDVTLLPGNVNTTIVKGDVTGDGVVAMGDVVKVARAVAGNSTLTDDEKEAADVTGDKVVAMGDVVKIARYVAGSVTEL